MATNDGNKRITSASRSQCRSHSHDSRCLTPSHLNLGPEDLQCLQCVSRSPSFYHPVDANGVWSRVPMISLCETQCAYFRALAAMCSSMHHMTWIMPSICPIGSHTQPCVIARNILPESMLLTKISKKGQSLYSRPKFSSESRN